jgi:hypothetical protein
MTAKTREVRIIWRTPEQTQAIEDKRRALNKKRRLAKMRKTLRAKKIALETATAV